MEKTTFTELPPLTEVRERGGAAKSTLIDPLCVSDPRERLMHYTHSTVCLGPGRELHTASAGPARPMGEVLFFPGNGCSSSDIGPMGDTLAERFRVTLLDPPGREPSVWPDEPCDFLSGFLDAVDEATSALALGPHVVIGHSMGGMLALQYANLARVREQRLVRGLVLIEGFVSLAIHGRVVSHEGFRAVRMSDAVREVWSESCEKNKAWEASHPAFHASFRASQSRHDARGFVASLGLPVLVIVGDLGQSMPAREDLSAWRKHVGMDDVRDFELMLVPGAGHWTMLDAPGEVTGRVEAFLKRVMSDG